MGAYIVRRLAQSVVILLVVSIIIFLMMRLLPGDPILMYLSQNEMMEITEEQLAYLRAQHGLDKPLLVQYFDWMSDVFRGNLGQSLFYHTTVVYEVSQRLPVTFHLGLMAFILSLIVGIPAGVICAVRRGTWIDTWVTIFANLGITVPVFWLGILLMFAFGLHLKWLPVCGYTSPFDDFWLSTRQSLMPIFCLAIFSIASLARQTRSSMLEVIGQDYIRTAWSKGLRERVIVLRHTIKNAMIPVITILGLQVGLIFGGSVLIERVFSIPGMGQLLADSLFSHDYQIVQAGTLVIAVVVVLTNLVVDISYGWFDPRIRYG